MAITKIATSSIELQYENYINILRTGQSVSDTGWSTYSDSAGVNPVDGIGGTATITWAQNTSNPLSGDADLRLVKDANNRQGDGVSIPFTITNRHLAKVLQISFDIELISGTYSTGDLRVSIIQDPTGTPIVLEPVNTGIQLGIANQRIRQIATFQTHISVTSYRLCIHVSSTSTSAYTVDFNNFKVWEPTQSVGSVITDWTSYTPTSPNSAYTLTSSQMFWRRVGGNLELQGEVIYNTTSGIQFRFPLPNGLTVTSNYTTSKSVGKATAWSTLTTYKEFSLKANGGNSYLTIGVEGESGGSGAINSDLNANDYASFASNKMTFIAFIPIQGWGSSVAMSSDSGDGRVVAAKYTNLTPGTLSASIPIRWNTKEYDTHNAVSIGTLNSSSDIWKFTAPISGYYSISGVASTSGSSTNLVLYKNETIINGLCYTQTAGNYDNFKSSIYLNAGEYISVRVFSSSWTSAGGQYSSIQIERISAGSQVIATQETVSASAYIGGGNQTTAAGNIINFNTKWHDTHNAITTDSSWRFTAPMNGKYQFSGYLALSNASQRTEMRKNGSAFLYGLTRQPSGSNYGGNFSVTIDLISGDYIDLRSTSSTDYYGGTPSSTGEPCYISINRIGI